jgi:large subunit ribosomal protein L10
MLKKEKIEFVKKTKAELKHYKTIGVMPIEAIPDRLVQKIRNRLKPDSKFVIARKNLIFKILEGHEDLKALEPHITGNVALILSNDDPIELYNKVSSNPIRLGAKPNQISPEDINIESGETSIAPGQAVTDLKAAGIDVKIDKGKVVISKSKVLVAKGAKITTPIAKALKMLDVMPFEAKGRLSAAMQDHLLFNENVLKINKEYIIGELSRDFAQANALTIAIKFVTPYNATMFVSKALNEAVALGIEAKIYEKEIVEKLLGIASAQAKGVNALVKKEE